MKVCIGGTFNKLHKGHKALISKALDIAGENGFVFIGITVGKIIENKKNVSSYDFRKKEIEHFIKEKKKYLKILIEPIYDKYGPSVDGDFDAIIVSPETKKTAEEINIKRKKIDKKPLKIFQIPFILAEDKVPISSTRIFNDEINENGEII